ncbi:MAG: hypothetical protein HFH60_02270 [Lachnospiraceae bacterium]|nr:hypothetical protein [Lachnospiraceae bacterium]
MSKPKSFLLYMLSALLSACLLHPVLPAQKVSAAAKATGAKIHFINLNANNDAILLECNGAFGMVDSGEDNGYPNGKNKRYPWRAGIVKGKGQGQNVINYLQSVGVKRLEFYIGTHPHSDHIGNAHQIIKKFRPKRVYLRPYKDSYITNKTRLWDNLYVYDNALNAVKEVNRQAANAEDGITLIQYFKKNATYVDPLRKLKSSSNATKKKTKTRAYKSTPVFSAPPDASPNEEIPAQDLEEPETEDSQEGEITVSDAAPVTDMQGAQGISQEETVIDYTPMIVNDTYDAAPLPLTGSSSPQTAKPKFTLGDGMTIEILNYEEKLSAPDANYFCLGVKVTANGSTAFLSGDINNYRGAEDRLASQLGHVDILKLGHHGYYGSNTTGYLKRLSPDIAVLTGTTGQIRQQMWDALASTNTRTYITSLYAGSAGATIVNMNRKASTNIGQSRTLANKIVSGYSVGLNGYLYLKNGRKVVGGGFQRVGQSGYYFPAGSDKPLTDQWLKHKNKWYYLGPDGRTKTGWLHLNSHWYYCSQDGDMQVGWIKSKGKKYYLNSKGRMITGDKKIGKHWYYFRSDGSMLTGWLNNRYYYDEQGRWVPSRNKSGWQKYEAGYKWRFKSGSFARNTWKTIKGSKYYFHANGYRATGITKIKGKKYYFNSSGKLTSGWQTVKGKKYYFTPKGMRTGFQTIHKKKYYFRPDGSLLQKKGLKTIGKYTYCFNANHTVATGWKTINGKKYYFTPNGTMQTGWQTISGKKYCFASNGALRTGWQTISGRKYYFASDGTVRTGWQTISGKKYSFASNGAMRTGWQTIEGRKYYFASNGAMRAGWQSIDGKRYYFAKNGMMQTGWLTTSGNKYYLDADGSMLTGWQSVDGNQYYFDSQGAAMQGFQSVDNCHYLFDQSGALQQAPAPGWHSFNGTDYYYFQTESALYVGWLPLEQPSADGELKTVWRYLDPQTGTLVTGLTNLPSWDDPANGETYDYYFLPRPSETENEEMTWGAMVTNQQITITQEDGAWTYDFDENGRGSLHMETQNAPAPEPEFSASENSLLPESEEEQYAH